MACPEPGSQEVREPVPKPRSPDFAILFPAILFQGFLAAALESTGLLSMQLVRGKGQALRVGLCALSQAVHSILGHSARM